MAYTYLIGWRNLDVWYYGRRTANIDAPLEDLWHRYFTSSKFVKESRHQFGEPDVVRVHREFESPQDACRFEERFLRRVSAMRSPRWLNQNISGEKFKAGPRSAETKEKIAATKRGKPRSAECRAKIGVTRRARAIPSSRKGKKHTPESIEKMRIAHQGAVAWNRGIPCSPEQKAAQSLKMKGRPKKRKVVQV